MKYINGFTIIEQDDDFPNPIFSPGDSPLAVGQDLTPELMLRAYKKGIFAWSSEPVTWWSPEPRAIIELDELYVSKRLARKIRQQRFTVTVDRAFDDVMFCCSLPRASGEDTWISEEFTYCFNELFRRGYGHSVECWQQGELVGGLFGVAIGGFFSAESMFHTATDASKIALYYLVALLKRNGFSLLDIQVLTPHTASQGGILIPRIYYLQRLANALKQQPLPIKSDELAVEKINH